MKAVFLNMIFVLSASNALCCFAPKPEQNSSTEDLVKRTKEIYLAEVVERDNQGFIFFKVIETLKGKPQSSFRMQGVLTNTDGTDFQNHSNEDFWAKSGGRSQIEPNCQITPTFLPGKKYLVFVDKPYHLKSFEIIENANADVWLKKVNIYLKRRK